VKTRSMWKRLSAMGLVLVLLVSMVAGIGGPPAVQAATEAEIEQAIVDGLAYLASVQNPDGSWSVPSYVPAKTCMILTKFQDRAYELGYESPFDPAYEYHQNVIDGWTYIFSDTIVLSQQTNVQPAGDPDSNGNGYGLYIYGEGNHLTYATGVCLMALGASKTPDRENEGGLDFNGDMSPDTYLEIAQDITDWLAMAQTDGPSSNQGGWYYGMMDNDGSGADQSNSGFATLGVAYGEEFGIVIPAWVKSELSIWIDAIQDDTTGCSHYTLGDMWFNIYKQGHLLNQMVFVGDDPATSPRVEAAIQCAESYWMDSSIDPGWGYNYPATANYLGMYSVMKGFGYSGVDLIDTDGDGTRDDDWYNQEPPKDPPDDFATVLVAQQNVDGSWPNDCYWGYEYPLCTVWALFTLEKVFPQPPLVDMSIDKTDSPDPAYSGDTLVYTLSVANEGGEDATGVAVTDTLPVEVTYVSDDWGCSHAAGVVTCDLGDMAMGDSVTIQITVDIDPAFVGLMTNVAEVGANEADVDPDNNVDTEETSVEAPEVDLSVTKDDSHDPAYPGDTLVYSVTVQNAGPGDATMVTVTDTLPAEVVYVSDDAGCSHAAGTLTCDLGDMTAGAMASFMITVEIDAEFQGVMTNTVMVDSTDVDIDPSNNEDTEETTVELGYYYIPHVENLTGDSLSSIQVVNVGDEETDITIYYYDPTGALVDEIDDTIAAGGSKVYFPIHPDPEFVGAAIVEYTGEVAALANFAYIGGAALEASSYQGFPMGGPELLLPLTMKDNNSNDSVLAIQNTTGNDVDITISFTPEPGMGYDDTIADINDTLPAWSSHFYDLRTLPEFAGTGQWVGSVLVTVDGEGAVCGMNQQIDSLRGTATAATGFLQGADSLDLPLIMDNNNHMWTSVNCQNLGPGDNDITVTFFPEAGYPAKAPQTKTAVPEDGTAVFLQDPFGARWVGAAKVTADNPVVCVVNQLNLNLHYASAYSGFDVNALSDRVIAPSVQFQDQGDGMHLWTGINIQNLGDTAATVTIDFVPETGHADIADITLDIDPGAVGVHLFFDPYGDGNNAVGGALITSDGGQPLAVVINQNKLNYDGDVYMSYNGFPR
jgi:uncharacterized repeat protein (TIGR01451 family)